MSIRPIDMQTIIPKTPEVQKIKSLEPQNQQNNQVINMHKEQQDTERTLKQVNDTKKASKGRIERENKNKQNSNSKNQKKKNNNQEDNDNNKPMTSIDIRI